MIALIGEQLCTTISQFWLTLALIGIPGVLGGFTYAISIFLKAAPVETAKWPPSGHLSRWGFYAAHGITGLGGSLAALLVTLWANRFPKDVGELQAMLTLTCTGFVSGYVANKLLPAIADNVLKRLSKLADQQEDLTEKQALLEKKVEEENKNSVDLTTELTRARDYLSSKTFIAGQTGQLLESLSSLAKAYPTNRVLHILLSRTWDEADGNRAKAIEVLGIFIQSKRDAGEVDEHLATAYWNRANYFEEDFKKTGVAKSRELAVESLRLCIESSPSYLDELLRDEDFAELLKSTDRAKLVLES